MSRREPLKKGKAASKTAGAPARKAPAPTSRAQPVKKAAAKKTVAKKAPARKAPAPTSRAQPAKKTAARTTVARNAAPTSVPHVALASYGKVAPRAQGRRIQTPMARAGTFVSRQQPASKEKVSLTIPAPLMEEVRERVAPGQISAYVTQALQHQLDRDNLADVLAQMEETNGPVTEAEIEAALANWPT